MDDESVSSSDPSEFELVGETGSTGNHDESRESVSVVLAPGEEW